MPGLISVNLKKDFSATKAKDQLRRRVPIIINDALGIIKSDITFGIQRQIDINNRPLIPLKPKTVAEKRKLKVKYPTRALWREGIMQNTYFKQRAKIGNLTAILRIAKSRVEPEIGRFHQEGEGNNPIREWFGMSNRARATIDKMLGLNIRRLFDGEFHLR